jgi:hypothetical protein
MDELEQLDFLPSCGIVKEEEEESNTHRSSAGSDTLTTPNAKRRKSVGRHPLSPFVKSEQLEQHESSAASKFVGADLTDGDEDSCFGCARSKTTGRCFIDSSNLVRWALPDRRGRWCSDCHQCWRTHWSFSHTLSLFTQWLGIKENMKSWSLSIVASLSLSAEGHSKITSGMIGQRIGALQFMMKMLGVPVEPFCIVMLEDLGNKAIACDIPSDVNPNHLVVCATPLGDRLGVLVPHDVRKNPHSMLLRPEGPVEYVGMRRFLSSSFSCEHEKLASLFRDSDSLVKLEGQGNMVLAAKEERRPALTKLEAKLQVLQKNSMDIVKAFSSDLWESVKESAYSKIVNEWQGFKHEAEDSADTIMQYFRPGNTKITSRKLYQLCRTTKCLEHKDRGAGTEYRLVGCYGDIHVGSKLVSAISTVWVPLPAPSPWTCVHACRSQALSMDLEQLFAFDIASTIAGYVSGWPDIFPWANYPPQGLALWVCSTGVRAIWVSVRANEVYLKLLRESRESRPVYG